MALTHAAVRRGLLQPFGWWPRFVRRTSDPMLRPVERKLVTTGRNPQDATLWLAGGAVVAGLLFLTLVRWLLGLALRLAALRDAGPAGWLRFGVGAATSLLMAALVIRVVGLWLGFGRYHRAMRPFYLLTDWILEPVRRRLPAFGPLDLSPLVVYFGLLLLRSLLLAVIG